MDLNGGPNGGPFSANIADRFIDIYKDLWGLVSEPVMAKKMPGVGLVTRWEAFNRTMVVPPMGYNR